MKFQFQNLVGQRLKKNLDAVKTGKFEMQKDVQQPTSGFLTTKKASAELIQFCIQNQGSDPLLSRVELCENNPWKKDGDCSLL